MIAFERYLLNNTVENIEFRKVNNEFQSTLKDDAKKINSSAEIYVAADKSRNVYKMKPKDYDKLLTDNI